MDTEKTSNVAQQEELSVFLILKSDTKKSIGSVSFPGKVDIGQLVSWMRRNGLYGCSATGALVRRDTPMLTCFDVLVSTSEKLISVGETNPAVLSFLALALLTGVIRDISIGTAHSGAKGEIGLSRVN